MAVESQGPETFASYTDSFVNALLDAAGGQVVDAGTTAQVEFAAGLWQRTLSSAEVEPSHLGSLITPDVLGAIARGLVLRGQVIGVIEDGGLVLASDAEVTGGPTPSSWRFKVTLDGPSRSQTVTLGHDDVLRFTWSTDPRRPWQGIGPLGHASVSAALLARLEGRMSEEASAISGHLLSVPDTDPSAISKLQEDLRTLKGRTAFVRTSKNWGSEEGKVSAGVPGEYVQRRIGATIPHENIRLREMPPAWTWWRLRRPWGLVPKRCRRYRKQGRDRPLSGLLSAARGRRYGRRVRAQAGDAGELRFRAPEAGRHDLDDGRCSRDAGQGRGVRGRRTGRRGPRRGLGHD